MSGPTESSSAVYKAETLTRGRASHQQQVLLYLRTLPYDLDL